MEKSTAIVVDNRRAGRRVVQRQVLYLGEINDSEREAWSRGISVFDEDRSEEQQLKLYPADRSLPCHAEAQGILGLWMPTAYMGTFGKYGMAVVRKRVREK